MDILSIIASAVSIVGGVVSFKEAKKVLKIKNEIKIIEKNIKLQANDNTFINSPGAIQYTEHNK